MHFVGRVDWSFADGPATESPTTSGLARRVLVGPEQGAVHTELAVGALAPGGWIARHVHSFEEGLYLLEGQLVLEIDTHVHRLVPGDYALIPIATRHTLVAPRDEGARWLVGQHAAAPSARRRGPGHRVRGGRARHRCARRPRRARSRAATRRSASSGHYEGTPPQQEALRLTEPARGRRPAGADTALIAYSGISVKMLIDRVLGADHLTMFTVDYEVGGAAQAHDHPFEEAYFFLAGEVEAELDGSAYTLRPGDVVFAGVASVHGFWNAGLRAGPLDRDAGAPAAGARLVSLGADLGADGRARGGALAGAMRPRTGP